MCFFMIGPYIILQTLVYLTAVAESRVPDPLRRVVAVCGPRGVTIPYQVVYRTNVKIIYILLIIFFYDWSIYNPTNTCVFNRLYTM